MGKQFRTVYLMPTEHVLGTPSLVALKARLDGSAAELVGGSPILGREMGLDEL